ncbi:unnamed protein product [Urochloa humidicola]
MGRGGRSSVPVAVEAGVVASEVLDAVDAVAEDAEAEEDADEQHDHQDHQQAATHPLFGELELAHGGRVTMIASKLSLWWPMQKPHAASYRRRKKRRTLG